MFRQGFPCPALLKDRSATARTGLSPSVAELSSSFRFATERPLAWSAFARHY